jgi:hypothetical protein
VRHWAAILEKQFLRLPLRPHHVPVYIRQLRPRWLFVRSKEADKRCGASSSSFIRLGGSDSEIYFRLHSAVARVRHASGIGLVNVPQPARLVPHEREAEAARGLPVDRPAGQRLAPSDRGVVPGFVRHRGLPVRRLPEQPRSRSLDPKDAVPALPPLGD